jgi:hypothetical protein
MLVLVLGAAFAARDPVLVTGDPDVAIERVSADSGRPVWQLVPARVADLGGSAPIVVGQPAPACAAGERNAELQAPVGAIEGRIAYGKFGEAAADLDPLIARFACLSEPAEASLGARLLYLRGIAAMGLGDEPAARAAWTRALAFQPSLAWDDRQSPDWKPTFDDTVAAASKAPSGELLLGPGLDAPVWLDGHAVAGPSVHAAQGQHLVQVLRPVTVTLPVTLAAVRTVVLAPDAVDDHALIALATANDPVLTALADTAFPGAGAIYVWTGSDTLQASGAGWDPLPPSSSANLASRHALGRRMLGGGLAALALGAGSFVAGAAVDGTESAPIGTAAADAEGNARSRAQALRIGGLASAGVGVVMIGISLPLAGG